MTLKGDHHIRRLPGSAWKGSKEPESAGDHPIAIPRMPDWGDRLGAE